MVPADGLSLEYGAKSNLFPITAQMSVPPRKNMLVRRGAEAVSSNQGRPAPLPCLVLEWLPIQGSREGWQAEKQELGRTTRGQALWYVPAAIFLRETYNLGTYICEYKSWCLAGMNMQVKFYKHFKLVSLWGAAGVSSLFHASSTAVRQLLLGNLAWKQNSKVFAVIIEKPHAERVVSKFQNLQVRHY